MEHWFVWCGSFLLVDKSLTTKTNEYWHKLTLRLFLNMWTCVLVDS